MDPNTQNPPIQEAAQQSPLQQIQYKTQTGGKKKYFLLLIIAIIILTVFLATVFFILTRPNNNTENKKIDASPTPILQVNQKPTLQPFPKEGDYVKDELIISYAQGKNPSEISDDRNNEIDKIMKSVGVISQEKLYRDKNDPILGNFYLLKFKTGTNIEEAMIEIYKIPEISGVETNLNAKLFK